MMVLVLGHGCKRERAIKRERKFKFLINEHYTKTKFIFTTYDRLANITK
jgi:hypothetical protein